MVYGVVVNSTIPLEEVSGEVWRSVPASRAKTCEDPKDIMCEEPFKNSLVNISWAIFLSSISTVYTRSSHPIQAKGH
eukprot:scaffold14347_cov50-Cyclotella_meneghiniana.AAC.4